MRLTCIHRWKTEKTPEVFKRFAEQLKGTHPEIIEADKKIKTIAFEFGSAFGQAIAIWIIEGEPRDISTILRFWMDLQEIEVVPTVSFDLIKQYYPDRHPHWDE